MPVKRRRVKGTHIDITAARSFYRAHCGIEGVIITEAALAEMLGRSELIAYPDMDELRALLEEPA
jgi:hypothetical protein